MSRFKKITTAPAFWKSVFGLALAFIVIYNLVMFIFDGFTFQPLLDKATNETVRFLIANILSGFIYGLIVAYLQFNRKLKDLEK